MKRLVDMSCQTCGKVDVDIWVEPGAILPCECGNSMSRHYAMTKAACVIGDDIPGGLEVRHGLVHDDGSPMRFYTKSAMHAEGARRGLRNEVVHKRTKVSDKSAYTSQWF